MDILRRSERMSRIQKIRSEEIKRQMGVEGTVREYIERKQLIWEGYLQSTMDTSLQKQIL